MSGIPALTVELDGGLGWADISEYVLKAGVYHQVRADIYPLDVAVFV